MSKELLDRAYDLIIYEKYDEARGILEGLRERSSTARRWLANLPDDTNATQDIPEPEESVEPVPGEDDLPIEETVEVDEEPAIVSFVEDSINDDEDSFGLDDDDFADDFDEFMSSGELNADMETVAGATLDDLEQERELRFDDPQLLPMVAESMPLEGESPVEPALDDDLMPIDETADVLPTDEFVPSDGKTRWEYREVVLKDWHQHISNIEYALEQGGEKITIEDAYTKLLNESGAQGWEVVSEEVLPQQYVRLLMKRLVLS